MLLGLGANGISSTHEAGEAISSDKRREPAAGWAPAVTAGVPHRGLRAGAARGGSGQPNAPRIAHPGRSQRLGRSGLLKSRLPTRGAGGSRHSTRWTRRWDAQRDSSAPTSVLGGQNSSPGVTSGAFSLRRDQTLGMGASGVRARAKGHPATRHRGMLTQAPRAYQTQPSWLCSVHGPGGQELKAPCL